ncbi:UNVERIFIED_ORG: hypothetical protein J2W85_001533 [Ensifer adhaerens]|nr:hypothetical protein [Ensifer adhaerens]
MSSRQLLRLAIQQCRQLQLFGHLAHTLPDLSSCQPVLLQAEGDILAH